MKGSSLGRFACHRLWQGCRFYAHNFFGQKLDLNVMFWPFCEGFETTKSSTSKSTVHRSYCAPAVFLQGSYQGCSAEGPGSGNPEGSEAKYRQGRTLLLCGNLSARM